MLNDYITMLRPRQWYKNLVILIAIFFSGQLFYLDKLTATLIGLVALCTISSTNYIINDLVDRDKDIKNPEKQNRPITTGRITMAHAVIIAAILFIISLTISYNLSSYFFLAILSLFIITTLYTFLLKNEPLVDIIIISILFVIRAVSGAFIINVYISPWLIVGTFFLSIFLSLGKRVSENKLLDKPQQHRKTLEFYTEELSKSLLMSAATVLIVSFSLYSFLAEHQSIIFALPVFFYLIIRYLQLIYSSSQIPRHPELIFMDLRFIIGMGLMIMLSLTFIYA